MIKGQVEYGSKVIFLKPENVEYLGGEILAMKKDNFTVLKEIL